MKKISVCFLLISVLLPGLFLLAPAPSFSGETEYSSATIYFFWGVGCPYCEQQKEFLERMQRQYPEIEVKSYEVVRDQANQPIFRRMGRTYGIEATSVPITFIGDFEPVRGFNKELATKLEEMIKYCLENYCVDPAVQAGLREPEPGEPAPVDQLRSHPGDDGQHHIAIPYLGRVNLSEMPLFLMTSLVAFVDGFNPCSLWLITLLLGIVIPSGSRKKALIVSLTFLLVTASAYGMFVLGVLHAFFYIQYMTWIRIAVAAVAFIFAIVNIKDYFWYKKGISFTIPEKYQPKIFRNFREIAGKQTSYPHLIFGVAMMALGVVLVELPCTAGFPVIWSSIVGAQPLQITTFIALFLLYIFIYLIIELAIVVTAIVTLKSKRLEEIHGRILKLLGGTIMLGLAISMVFIPEAMETIGGVLTIFAASVVATCLIIVIDRIILRRSNDNPAA